MARTFAAAGLLVAVLLVCGISVQATFEPSQLVKDVTKDVSKCNPTSTAMSCLTLRATSYGGWARAYANSSAKATAAAANACAKAIVKAYDDLGDDCNAVDAKVWISQVARACARASLKLRTSSYVEVKSGGNAEASAKACGTSTASASAFATAIVKATIDGMSDLLSTDDEHFECSASSDVSLAGNVSAIAKVVANGMAASWASAYTKYKPTAPGGSASALTYALFAADVATYARATTKALAYACAACKSKGYGCGLCKGFEEGTAANSDGTAEANADYAAGTSALAYAFSDALAAACNDRASAKATVNATLKAIADVCIQLTADTYAWAQARDNSMACGYSTSNGTASGLSEAYGSLVADAYAEAVKSKEDENDCLAKGASQVLYSVFSKLEVTKVISSVAEACQNGTRGYVAPRVAAPILVEKVFVKELKADAALEQLLNQADLECGCEGKGFCCTTCGPEQEDGELCPMVEADS